MSKRPWMPLYVGDFIADTQHLSATETGIYLRLIMHCWQHGSIPRDSRKLALIAHCDTRLWHQYEETVLRFFDVVDASTMYHKRVATELLRCQEISNKRKGAAKQKHSNSSANDVQLHTHSHSHSHKKERKTPAAKEPPEFNDFWMSVPKREGSNPRIPALKSYQKAIREGADPAQINAAAKRWARESLKTEPKFVAMAVTWLNQKRFEDYHVKPEAESNVVFDETTKLWEFREGYEPTDEEREAHANYRRTAIATRIT